MVGEIKNGKIRVKIDNETNLGVIGERKRKYIYLDNLETLYLSFVGKLEVKERKSFLSFEDLVTRFSHEDEDIFVRFLVYRDLRSRGYIVKRGYGEKIDFLVYERGDYPDKPAKIRVIGVDEGNPLQIVNLIDVLKFTIMSKKELKIAVIERRGEVVYYTLKGFIGGKLRENLG